MSTVKLPTQGMVKSIPMTTPKSSMFKGPVSLGSVKRISKSFGLLSSSSGFRATAMAVYKVKMVCPDGEEHEFEAPMILTSLTQQRMPGLSSLTPAGRVPAQPVLGRLKQGQLTRKRGPFSMKTNSNRVICSLVFLTRDQTL